MPLYNRDPSCSYVPQDIFREGLPLIYADSLSFSFQDKQSTKAINGVSFGIREGTITAIIGSSGSGKSTLLRLIYGLLHPDGGEVRYRGWKVPGPKEKLIPGHEAMRMVSQNFDDLNTYAKAWDNVASRLSNTDLEAKQRKTEDILEALSMLHRAQHRVADLSGGEKQRVAIARALVDKPQVLLLDEPFNQVDAALRETLQQDIRNIVKQRGLTVVLVSHDPAEVLAMADQLLVLRSGELMASGQPQKLYQEPPNEYTARLLATSNILSAAEAANWGVQTQTTVAIHAEWITLHKDGNTPSKVVDVSFRGFYEELLVEKSGVTLRAINYDLGQYPVDTAVAVTISHFWPFTQ